MTLNLTRHHFAVFLCLLVTVAVVAQPSVLPQTGSSTNITPVVAVSPTVLPAGGAVEMFITITNGNPTSTKQIQASDTFTITANVGVWNGASHSLLVNSATLSPSDFSVTPNGNALFAITYTNSTPKTFQPGDSLNLKLIFMVPSFVGSYGITCQGPYVKGASNGRFNEVVARFTTVQIASVASPVTNVTASGPLQSSGGTTPDVSLTGVVLLANGGTGANLSATGGTGQYLKQATVGGAVTVATISTNDIPDLSGSYVKNSTSQQSGAAFNISGNGIIGGNVGIGAPVPAAKLHVAGGDLLFENKWRTETTASTPNLIGGFLGTGSGGATPGNRVTPGVVGATIGGGGFNGTINFPNTGTFGGDNSNRVTDSFGTVGGGFRNRAGNDDFTPDNANFATVGGGSNNWATAFSSTVGGGWVNSAMGFYSTVGGGHGNSARGGYSTIGGGVDNFSIGNYSTVGGGLSNTASGDYSFAAGRRAKANHQGAFVWADSTDADFASTANNQFLIRATGGVGIGTTSPKAPLDVRGDIWTSDNIFFKADRANSDGRNWAMRMNNTHEGDFQIGFTGNNTSGLPDFFTNPSDAKLTIRNNGNVGIGMSSPTAKFHVQSNNDDTVYGESLSGTGNGVKGVSTGSGTGVVGVNTNTTAGFAGYFIGRVHITSSLIVQNGCTGCGSSPSDLRLKQNVAQLGHGLNTLMQLRPVSWRWKDQSVDSRVQLGFIAQEVEQLLPELIGRGNDSAQTLNLNYLGMVPVVVRAIQEQQQHATTQQQQLEQLKQQNAQLAEQNEALKKENAAIEARLAALEKMMLQVATVKK